MSKIFKKILEFTWLTVAVISLLAGIHKSYRDGFKESLPFLIITIIAVMMYMFRRHQRISQK